MPTPIQELLTSPLLIVFAKLVLTSFFWIAGLFGIVKFDGMVHVIRAHGLRWPRAVVALMIVTELVGSALLVTDFRSMGWLGAGALAVFTLLSIPLGHPFWRYQAPKRMDEFQIALEHVGMVGGLVCAAVLTVR